MYGGETDTYGGIGGYGDTGASQFAGGGFMPTPSEPNPANAFSGGGDKRGGSSSQNTGLVPLTIRQISQAAGRMANDDNFIVDGCDVQNVKLVGKIISKDVKSTDITFVLDDGTGRVDVKRWLDGDPNEAQDLAAMEVGAYARVYGNIRSFQDVRRVVAFAVRPIIDFNEVTFHNLECIFVHLTNTKGQGSQLPVSGSGYGGAPTPIQPMQGGGLSNQYKNQYPIHQNGAAMTELQRKVQAIYEDPSSASNEAGLHFSVVAEQVPGYTMHQVRGAIDFLVSEGHLYSTIDDNHFKSTNQ